MLHPSLLNFMEMQMSTDEGLMYYNEYRPQEFLGDVPLPALLSGVFERNVASFNLSA